MRVGLLVGLVLRCGDVDVCLAAFLANNILGTDEQVGDINPIVVRLPLVFAAPCALDQLADLAALCIFSELSLRLPATAARKVLHPCKRCTMGFCFGLDSSPPMHQSNAVAAGACTARRQGLLDQCMVRVLTWLVPSTRGATMQLLGRPDIASMRRAARCIEQPLLRC